MRYLAITSLICFFLAQEALGHGAMYYPNPWWARSGCLPFMSPETCRFDLVPPETGCTGRCRESMGLTSFFTNYTVVEKRTLPKEFLEKFTRSKSPAGKHPWNSPGAAPVFGNGCGANGGNPNGCIGDDDVVGRCCGGSVDKYDGIWDPGCGGFVGGKTAVDYYEEGFFKHPWGIPTTWERGTNQEVMWKSKAYHRGGYAYRLCKVENGKFWKVTEECFQNGHLKFAGDTTWTYYDVLGDEPWNNDNWVAQPIIKTNEGTTPEGSEWVKINLPSHGGGIHWAFKDLVEIPEDLEPGEYVLSFRWDCQQSPQVWNSCANIQVV